MDLVKLLPMHPEMSDSQINDWLLAHGGRGREVLTYQKVKIRNPLTEELEPYAKCRCSVCGAEWYTTIVGTGSGYPHFENVEGLAVNGQFTTCPECGAKLEAAYYTRLRRYPIKSMKYPWEIVKKDGCIIFLCWAVLYEIGADGATLETEPRNAYMVDAAGKWHRFTAMERSGWSSMSKMEYIGEWYEKKKFEVCDGNFSVMLPHDPAVYEGTPLENAKLECLEAASPHADLITYARVFLRHPTAENITRNSPGLMAAILLDARDVMGMEWISWEKAKPHEMLQMEKPDYRRVSSATSAWELYPVVEKQKAVALCEMWGSPKEYAPMLGAEGVDFAMKHRRDKLLRPWGLVQTWNYVLKQAATQKKETLKSVIDLCEDYWRDIGKAGFDVKSRVVVFPKNLTEAHARAVAAIKYAENEALKAQFAKQAKRLAPLAWEKGGLLIVPAQNESELIREGKILEHCVGGYGKEHCAGNSIFFIRRVSAADIPLSTLQLNTKTGRIIQNRAKKNAAPPADVRAFAACWEEEVVKPWIEKKHKKPLPPERATA